MRLDYFNYDEEKGCTICRISKGELIGYGQSQCHPEDEEFSSEFTGGHIAESRALIDLERQELNNLKPQLVALKHLQSCVEQSKQYNPDSYEAKMILRQINFIEKQIKEKKNNIIEKEKTLKSYIEYKNRIHSKCKANSN